MSDISPFPTLLSFSFLAKNPAYGRQQISWRVRIVASIQKSKKNNAEYPTHHGPSPPRNTLLNLDLPNRGSPYSPWTCPTTEHPTHRGPDPPGNTLLIVDLPHRGIPHIRETQNLSTDADSITSAMNFFSDIYFF